FGRQRSLEDRPKLPAAGGVNQWHPSFPRPVVSPGARLRADQRPPRLRRDAVRAEFDDVAPAVAERASRRRRPVARVGARHVLLENRVNVILSPSDGDGVPMEKRTLEQLEAALDAVGDDLSPRVEELAQKSTDGLLTPEERQEYAQIVRLNDMLSLLK